MTSSTASSPDAYVDAYVVDTHVLFWFITAQGKLSGRVQSIFRDAEHGNVHLFVSAITAAELYLIYQKQGAVADFARVLPHLLSTAYLTFVPVEAGDTRDFGRDAAVPEMHDQIIVGLARRLAAPLITVDGQIRASGAVQAVW